MVQHKETLAVAPKDLRTYWLEKIYSGGDKLAQMQEIKDLPDSEWMELLEIAKKNPPILAFLALYPRFFGKKAGAFYKMLEETRPTRLAKSMPAPFADIHWKTLGLMLPHLTVTQLSYGCTEACSFCDVAAPYPRVDGKDSLEHIPVEQMEALYDWYDSFRITFEHVTQMTYWASDPASHPNFNAIAKLQESALRRSTTIVSHVPKDGIETIVAFLKDRIAGRSLRISTTRRSYDRVTDLLGKLGSGNPLPKPASNSDGQNLAIGRHPFFGFPVREAFGSHVKTETLGANMGYGTHPEGQPAFGCQSGVMFTPLSLYSKVHSVNPDENYPFGDIIVPIDKIAEITNPNVFIGKPVEELLKMVIVHGTYCKRDSITDPITFKVTDKSGKVWSVKMVRKEKRWITEFLVPYRVA